MDLNEAQTRQHFIDQQLLKAGWNVKDPAQVTEELDIWVGLPEGIKEPKTPFQGHLFADYVLLGSDGKPIAVVEAKKTSVDAEKGKEQARNYAEKIQKKTGGVMPLVFYSNGYKTYYWDTEHYPPRQVYGYPTRQDMERILFLRENRKPLSRELINTNIAGRPYQIEAMRSLFEELEKNKRKNLLVMATGTGKTRVCVGLIDVLMRTNWVQRVLFLVDRVALKEQALDAFKDYLPNAPIWPKQGETEIETDRRVYVDTYPSILNIIQSDDSSLNPHFFDLIIADESHRSIYNVYKNIFDYFDALELGLTATPKDHIDHNTFKLFNCDDNMPTYAYTYSEAVQNRPPYLCDFEVLKIRTKFQEEGINSTTIAEADKKRLLRDGLDPEEINYEGTELEKKISNKGSNVSIVRVFMEECIKDPDGVLPGKTIFFALSRKHAFRLCEIFNSLYPEYKGQLAEVIISDIKGVHGKGGILDRFKNNPMPRIAISVDMLDTGIDVRELVNLVFAKPVFSYTKFWQMIGRGTRVLDPSKVKPWCPKKDKFLIMDCWQNFEYFKMNPKGKDETTEIPLPVRLFLKRIEKIQAAIRNENEELTLKTIQKVQQEVTTLPENSVIVLEGRNHLDRIMTSEFWDHLNDEKVDYLKKSVAPVFRSQSEADFKAMHFEMDVLDTSIARLNRDEEQFDTLKEGLIETISELPLNVNKIAQEKDLIEKTTTQKYWNGIREEDYDELVWKLAPLMKYRQDNKIEMFSTDLLDLITVRDYIEFGSERESMAVDKYRQKVEEEIKELVKSCAALQKLTQGKEISENEIKELSDILKRQDIAITLETLRKVYDNRNAKFTQLVKHALGIEPIATFTESVSLLFDDYIRRHNDFTQQQIRFVQLVKTFLIQKGELAKKDLVSSPFTEIHPQGIRGIFQPGQIEEILDLINKTAA